MRELPFDGQGENSPMFAITGITGKVGGEVAIEFESAEAGSRKGKVGLQTALQTLIESR